MSSVAMYSPVADDSRFVDRGRFALVGLATVVAAVLANVLVYFVGSAAIGYDPDFVVLSNVAGTMIFTVVPAIIAVPIYAALVRFTSNPARIFTIVSAVLLVASIIPDITYIPTVEGSSPGQTAILILMHVVAAGVIVWMLTNLTRERAR